MGTMNGMTKDEESPESGMPSAISLIVPVGGDTSSFERCLATISRLDPPPLEVIVVLDGDDPSISKAADAIGAVVLMRSKSGGPAIARNLGARSARGDILFFADADVELPADTVRRIADCFAENPDLAGLFGSYDTEPAEPDFFSQYRNLLHHYVHQNAHTEASTFWAGCGAVRRSVFYEVGGFDEEYPVPCIEDIELGSRIRRAGYQIRLVKDLQVKHLKRWRPANMLATDLFRRAVPWTRLMLHEGQLLNDLNVKTNDRLSVALAWSLVPPLAAGPLWTPLLGAAAVISGLLLYLNRDLYRFFRKHRGFKFAIGAVFWHWLYLLICGLGFGLGVIRHKTNTWVPGP
jgi:GT2 family glycosyltransferase